MLIRKQTVFLSAILAYASSFTSAYPSTVVVPTTGYSLGRNVGGTDEMQDKWTNRGYSSTGQNLTPGVVAVNTSQYPLGTIFRDPKTGYCYIAADKHGNSNAKVVDFYKTPLDYRSNPPASSTTLEIMKSGAGAGSVGKTPEAIRAQLEQACGKGSVPPGESAKDFLAGKSASGGGSGLHYTRNGGFQLKPTSNDSCAYSTTMDRKAECDSTVKLVEKAKVLDQAVQRAGAEMVQLKGRLESDDIAVGGMNQLKSSYEAALNAARHGQKVLTKAGEINGDLAAEQYSAARRHRQKAEELRARIQKEMAEIQGRQVSVSRGDLARTGQGRFDRFSLKQKSVQQFKMNQAGVVDVQSCNEAIDPGCEMAKMRKRQGFEAKKQHIAELMRQLDNEVRKEQQAMELVAAAGGDASKLRAEEQLRSAESVRELGSTLSDQVEAMKSSADEAAGLDFDSSTEARSPASEQVDYRKVTENGVTHEAGTIEINGETFEVRRAIVMDE
jgi:hypothetical protein